MTHTYRLFLLGILLGLLAVALTAPAAAQTAGKSWEIGFGTGSGAISSDEDFELDLRVDGRAGYFLNDHVQLELQLVRADAVFDAQLSAAFGNLVVNFRPDARVVPYAFAGGGIARIEDVDLFDYVGEPEDDEDDGSAYQAGFGTRIFLGGSDVMALRLEASSLWTDTDLFGSTRNTSLTVGLSWSFSR